MKATIDKELCIGCGVCCDMCAAVFKMEDDGKAGAISTDIPDEALSDAVSAQDDCPVSAIVIE